MVAVGEKVLGLAELMRQEAAAIEPYNHGAADGLRRWADRFESTVQKEAPEWVSLREVVGWKGWSARYCRKLASRLMATGEARLTSRGWEFLYEYAKDMSVKPAHLRAIRNDGDLEELGRQMGARE